MKLLPHYNMGLGWSEFMFLICSHSNISPKYLLFAWSRELGSVSTIVFCEDKLSFKKYLFIYFILCASDPLELELQVILSHHVGAGTRIQVLCKSSLNKLFRLIKQTFYTQVNMNSLNLLHEILKKTNSIYSENVHNFWYIKFH